MRKFLFVICLLHCCWLTTHAPHAAEPAACATGGRLANTQFLPVGRFATGLTTGDFNQDGALDLVMADLPLEAQNGAVTTLLGNGRGGFAIASRIAINLLGAYTGGQPQLYAADFNRDGLLDLAGLGLNNGLAIFLGNGDGSFQMATIVTGEGVSIPAIFGVAIADLNGDNSLDLALSLPNAIQIKLGNGRGGFTLAATFEVPGLNGGIAAADCTGDGKPDLVFSHFQSLRLLINNGTGAFTAAPADLANLTGVNGLLAGDFNADNKTDLVTASFTESMLLYGNGSGGFSTPVSLGTLALIPRVADFNGDQRPDLVALTDRDNGAFTFLRGKAGGGFATPVFYGLPQVTFGTTVGDFNGDNLPDVAHVQRTPNGIAIAFNDGSGGFHAPRATKRIVGGEDFFITGDVNQDNKLDLLGNGIWLNDGQGNFARLTTRGADGIGDNSLFRFLALGDFNRGGRPEPVWTYYDQLERTYAITVGSFNEALELSPGRGFALGRKPSAGVATDYNRDGNLDLAVTFAADHTVSLLAGNGRGAFAPAVTLPTGLEPCSLVAGDFNGDTRQDFIVANCNSSTLTMLRQEANGSFTPDILGLGAAPQSVHAFDFNRDGKLDLFVPLANTAALALLAGNGDGTFRPLPPLGLTRSAPEIAVGDFNGDNRLDVMVSYLPPTNPSEAEIPAQLFRGDGQGGFTLSQEILAAKSGQVLAADFTGDAMTDALLIKGRYFWTLPSACLTAAAPLANVSAATYQPLPLAPDSIVAAFGTELATQTVTARTIPLPTQLGGVSVSLRDRNNLERTASLFFVSPNQINYLLPTGLATGRATVTVTTSANVTKRETILITSTAPGVFSANADGKDVPAAVLLRGKLNSNDFTTEAVTQFDTASQRFVLRPIRVDFGERFILVLFGTGWRNQKDVFVRFDGVRSDVLYAGAQGSFVGLDQMNLAIPLSFTSGIQTIDINIDGKPANRVSLSLVY